MQLSIWFWIIYFISLLFGFWAEYVPGQAYPYGRGMRTLVLYILLFIIGLKIFGSPISG